MMWRLSGVQGDGHSRDELIIMIYARPQLLESDSCPGIFATTWTGDEVTTLILC
jgi:hypothetical protein